MPNDDVQARHNEWRESMETIAALEAAKATQEKRVAEITTERNRAASTDAALFHQLGQNLAAHGAEAERLGIAIGKAQAESARAKDRYDGALKAAAHANIDTAAREIVEARKQLVGFLIPLMGAVGLLRRAISRHHSALRAAGFRTEGQNQGERLLGALNIRFDVIAALLGPEVLRDAVLAACEGAGYAPYRRTDIPYEFGTQLNDLLKGTFNARARDFESRPA